MLRVHRHRRHTDNHTWQVDLTGHHLFVKINPNPREAVAEQSGHARLRAHYPVPALRFAAHARRRSVLVYDRWPHLGQDHGLLLDTITRAERRGDTAELDAAADAIIDRYRAVIVDTLRRVPERDTVGKLYRDRAAPGGRLDTYYARDRPWRLGPGIAIRPSTLARTTLHVNDRPTVVDLARVTTALRAHFGERTPVWAALTQGDPTDLNLGWTRDGGPVWFDYDTAGTNSLAGEFACFLVYQRLHGAWLTPHENPAAFRDHPSALHPDMLARPHVTTTRAGSDLRISYRHRPGPARRHLMHRYLTDLVEPLAHRLGIDDVTRWLRPYVLLRLVAVFNLTTLAPREAALSLALTAQALDRHVDLYELLALEPTTAGDRAP